MAYRLITSVRRAGLMLKKELLTGNFCILSKVQPKRLDPRQYLSQQCAHPSTNNPLKGFIDKRFGPKEDNKSDTLMVGETDADSKSSLLSGGGGVQGGGEKEKSSGFGSGGKYINAWILAAICTACTFGACWYYFEKKYKEFHWKGVVETFLGCSTVEDAARKKTDVNKGYDAAMLGGWIPCLIVFLATFIALNYFVGM